ncbi:MAG: hypothetical protein KJ614_03795 [Gammaproteobacteria bacterium]|nr:hypothetical protein [Gammaproteobacteria bacterium]MBU3999202.1 hypothetical protein [Gammaproteobacteria bacterium]MBU4081765.1 hypothetical protein [Gammaproteobacteria bacterium]MBU4172890.1 hypothetical protein [Gammaproteobacteria bacterium]
MKRALFCLIGPLLAAALGVAGAQSLRDPTQPPLDAGVSSAPSAPSAARSLSFDSNATTVIVRNGHRYLAVGTRLYATGEKLGQARIERITETELWLREGGVLRKLPFFDGIERHAVSVPAANARKSRTQPRTPSPGVAPALDVRP